MNHQDVDVFLKRSIEVIRQAYAAELSYYRNSKQRVETEFFLQEVLLSQMEGGYKSSKNGNGNGNGKNKNDYKRNQNYPGKKTIVKAASTPGTPRDKSPAPGEISSLHYSPPSHLPESVAPSPAASTSTPTSSLSFNFSSLLIKPLKHLFTPSPPPLSSLPSSSSSSSSHHLTSLSLPSGGRESSQSSRFSSFINRYRATGSFSASPSNSVSPIPPGPPPIHSVSASASVSSSRIHSATPELMDSRGMELLGQGFTEQVESALWNLSRSACLLGLEYYHILQSDHINVRIVDQVLIRRKVNYMTTFIIFTV